jgi:hypothetical protein
MFRMKDCTSAQRVRVLHVSNESVPNESVSFVVPVLASVPGSNERVYACSASSSGSCVRVSQNFSCSSVPKLFLFRLDDCMFVCLKIVPVRVQKRSCFE